MTLLAAHAETIPCSVNDLGETCQSSSATPLG